MTNFAGAVGQSPTLKQFIIDFYLISDTKPSEEYDPYLERFTGNALLIMGSSKVEGHEAIRTMRQNMWSKIVKRHHVVKNVSAIKSNQYLLNGYIEYTFVNGQVLVTDFAGHMEFEPDSTPLKILFYQVYMDTSPTKEIINGL
ncbi:hypothetical protein HYPBUDRAFT_153028 [Hyphopichia burtonii NRRL Y-1933]|uniref:SnoaL-like domain-containing protein n=1 Tax=Hyphopichia burtonii NRRL Y-1933 TaxID=984485 RepID=A0A1E4RJ33_9ASCO|nr:hypothetical protein HYPBUDRAFT_153028 [Hyphopichia burtonii NRRL Y-1933]ODV67105.1 hypothetical protein HYPBUDRAFT_153028 [Hyphopichia burtonii NRRL Y-1933]